MELRKVDYAASGPEAEGNKEAGFWAPVAQIGALLWALGLFGYFYYSRGFLELARQFLKGEF